MNILCTLCLLTMALWDLKEQRLPLPLQALFVFLSMGTLGLKEGAFPWRTLAFFFLFYLSALSFLSFLERKSGRFLMGAADLPLLFCLGLSYPLHLRLSLLLLMFLLCLPCLLVQRLRKQESALPLYPFALVALLCFQSLLPLIQ